MLFSRSIQNPRLLFLMTSMQGCFSISRSVGTLSSGMWLFIGGRGRKSGKNRKNHIPASSAGQKLWERVPSPKETPKKCGNAFPQKSTPASMSIDICIQDCIQDRVADSFSMYKYRFPRSDNSRLYHFPQSQPNCYFSNLSSWPWRWYQISPSDWNKGLHSTSLFPGEVSLVLATLVYIKMCICISSVAW